MKDSRLVVSLALLVGAASLACNSFSSGGGGTGTTGSGGSPGTGGTDTTGTGGTSSGTGGIATTGTGGTTTTGTGGITTTGTGGVTTTGTGGTGTTGSGGTATGTGGRGAAVAGGAATGGTAGGTGTGGTVAAATPCSILAAAGNACVAAHSTVRVVYPGYTGPLYQLCKGSFTSGPKSCSSGMTQDIGTVAGGFADSTAHETFCPTGTMCTISAIYDQSPMKNDLKPAPAGGAKGSADNPANANDLKIMLGGHTVYGVLIKPSGSQGMGYRAGCTGCGVVTPKGTATGDQAETEYMVTSQKNLVDGCCFDYGNAETDSHDDGNGTMEAVYFGGGVSWGTGYPGGSGAQRDQNGPWVMADLENGLFAGWENGQDQSISTNTALKFDFVTAIVVGDTRDKNSNKGRFALYGADATTANLKTLYDGIRPARTGYVPMQKQGSIILGIGGDNSDGDGGEWFEGVMASGAASLATLNALQANIVAAGYGK
jgi:non-reducing end alpha-L-arabinofuranosidase